MDYKGNYETMGTEEEETRLTALHTRNCSAIEEEPGVVKSELQALKDHPSLRPEAKRKVQRGNCSDWYVFVRQLGDHYYIGRTVRHPALDIVLPAVLVDCVACTGYLDAGKKVKAIYKTYKKRYGARASYQRGYLMRSKKDPYTAPVLPEYSYDPAMVRHV